MARVAEPFLRLARRARRAADARASTTRRAATASRRARATSRSSTVATRRRGARALPPGGCASGVDLVGRRQALRVPQHVDGRRRALDRRRDDRRRCTRVAERAPEPDARQHAAVDARPEDAAREARARRRGAAAGRAGRADRAEHPGDDTARRARAARTRRATRCTSKHDEDLFDYYAALAARARRRDDRARSRASASRRSTPTSTLAPDGEHILVAIDPQAVLVRHDVRSLRARRRDLGSRRATAARVASLPLADRVPVHGVPTGPRDFEWRATEPATLVWAEALDGGDWKAKVPARDKVMMQKAPFTAPPVEITRTEQRFGGFDVGRAAEPRAPPRVRREPSLDAHVHASTSTIATAKPQRPLGPVERRALQGPGLARVSRELPERRSGSCARTATRSSSRAGLVARRRSAVPRPPRSEDAASPSASSAARRPRYESFLAFTGADANARSSRGTSRRRIRRTRSLRTLGAARAARASRARPAFASTPRAVTHIPDPTPAVRAIKKRLVKYKRKDGTDLSFTLYTPPDYKEGTRVPAILYAYPLDYADAVEGRAGHRLGADVHAPPPLPPAAARGLRDHRQRGVPDRRRSEEGLRHVPRAARRRREGGGRQGRRARRRRSRSHRRHRAQPRRADDGEPARAHRSLPRRRRDERLVQQDAHAVRLPERAPLGVGGARASTSRSSPFFFADKMKLPLLIMHGEDDANPGTTPLQATKLYEAIRGNGGTARLVMLPHEPHWYSAMESNEQLVARDAPLVRQVREERGPRATK